MRDDGPKGTPGPGQSSSLSHAGKDVIGRGPGTSFVSSDMPQFQNTSEKAAKEEEYRKRTERNIWMAVPQSKIYKRNHYESKMELDAKRKRLEKYEKADQLMQPNKNKKKDGDKAPPGLDASKTLQPAMEKKITKVEKQKDPAKSTTEPPVKKDDKYEIEALKKIRLEQVDPKTIDPRERKESMPPETKDLQKAVNDLINSKENSNKIDIKKI